MNCNATLTTLARTDDVVARRDGNFWRISVRVEDWPDGVTVTRDGDRLLRADVTVLTCDESQTHDPCTAHGRPCREHINAGGVVWCDDTEGATPHADDDPDAVIHDMLEDIAPACPDCDAAMADHEEGQHPGTADSIRELLNGAPCPDCDGTGWESWHGTEPFARVGRDHCQSCGGDGTTRGGPTGFAPRPCPDCDDGQNLVWSTHDADGFTYDEWEDCPSCGGTGTRPCDTRSVWRCHVDAAVDALAAEGVPMLDRDRLARAALDAAWRKAPWDMPGTRPANVYANDESKSTVQTRPAVTDAEVEAVLELRGGPCEEDGCNCQYWLERNIREELEAAARARQEDRDG